MRKLTIEQVRQGFEDKGWTLLSTLYLGSKEPMKAICPEGHRTKITYNKLQCGQGCGVCDGRQSWDFEELVTFFKEEGCELLASESDEITTNSSVNYKCVCGTISSTIVRYFLAGRRCMECARVTKSQHKQTTPETIKDFCEENNCKYIDSNLVPDPANPDQHNLTEVHYICSCGRETTQLWRNFRMHKHCKLCGYEKSGESRKKK